MLEHSSPEIKLYISDKIFLVIEDLASKNSDIFLYYVKTLILLPNLKSKGKDRIYYKEFRPTCGSEVKNQKKI